MKVKHIPAFLLLLVGCSSNQASQETAITSSPKFTQYYLQGEQLYSTHCSNCHQADGTGLGLLYPPLFKSDFMEKNFKDVICLIKNGRQGELEVNGKKFNQPMPGVISLTDLEIAEIATYIYNTWEHKRGIVDVTETSSVLKTCPEPLPYK